MRTNKYLQLFFPQNIKRTRQILNINPTIPPTRSDAAEVRISVYEFNSTELKEYSFDSTISLTTLSFDNDHFIRWINIDGLKKDEIENVCRQFNIHYLITEDILSIGQRPKMDEDVDCLFFLLNMLYYNNTTFSVEQEQISILLLKNNVITFQEDALRDAFEPLRARLKITNTKIRQSKADFLCYSLIDMIVDNYFIVMEQLGERIEVIENEIVRAGSTRSLARINALRKELIVLKRNVTPVRDIINSLLRSDTQLLEEKTFKYFKDIYDHIIQAADMAENYREMSVSMQDLYLNRVNLRLNESMKVMAIVTCLLAPATVIGGIFGMNFEHTIFFKYKYGFEIAVGLMFLIPLWMVYVFKRRGWF